MNRVIALACFGFCWWRVVRARERTAELVATGFLHSPLHWVSNALVAILLALVLYIAHIHNNQSPVPASLWIVVLAIIVALLFLRQALKWRYPE